MELNKVSAWKGVPITELSREELIEVIEYCGKEIIELRRDRDAWLKCGDVAEYLRNKVA